MTAALNHVERYGLSLGFTIRPKTVLVEGTTDVEVFEMAARLEEREISGTLLGTDLAIVAAGVRDSGGASGVIRELVTLRGLARTFLNEDGRASYRFIGLLDNDLAGRRAVDMAHYLDSSITEYKDVFRIRPEMPRPGNLDPGTIQRAFEKANAVCKDLDWEIEDLLTEEFLQAFCAEYPRAVSRCRTVGKRVHRDLTGDGKASLHRFIKQNAVREDLKAVIDVIRAIRVYLNLPAECKA